MNRTRKTARLPLPKMPKLKLKPTKSMVLFFSVTYLAEYQIFQELFFGMGCMTSTLIKTIHVITCNASIYVVPIYSLSSLPWMTI